MPNIIATKTIVFTDHNRISGSEVNIKVNPAPGAQEIPDWALSTPTWEMALKSGAIALLGEINPILRTPDPPTMEFILAAGYNTEEAEVIFTEEQRKANAGEPPYLKLKAEPKTNGPSVESLMAAGLDRTSAEKVIADREKKTRKQ